jgi:hypothetical protein
VKVVGGRLTFLAGLPRSAWLSAAGGVSVAYVFVHVLPELADHQREFARAPAGLAGALDHHVHLVALGGLVVFYGLEQLARTVRRRKDPGRDVPPLGDAATRSPAFWMHVASFAPCNVLVGYLLVHRYDADVVRLGGFTAALALRVVVDDHALRDRHGSAYARVGRWILKAAPVAGGG